MTIAQTSALSGAMKSLLNAKQDPHHVVAEMDIQLVLVASSAGSEEHRAIMQPYRELIAVARVNTPVPTLGDGHVRGA